MLMLNSGLIFDSLIFGALQEPGFVKIVKRKEKNLGMQSVNEGIRTEGRCQEELATYM